MEIPIKKCKLSRNEKWVLGIKRKPEAGLDVLTRESARLAVLLYLSPQILYDYSAFLLFSFLSFSDVVLVYVALTYMLEKFINWGPLIKLIIHH